MSTTQAATAVAPAVNGKDVAVHSVRSVTSVIHIGFTALAEITKYAGAHIACKIDSNLTVQGEADYYDAKTAAALSTFSRKLSGYKEAK